MKNKLFFAAGAALLLAATVLVSVCVNNGNDSMEAMFDANVEALARSEGLEKCNGCSTDKEIFCCHLIIVDVGGYFLYRD